MPTTDGDRVVAGRYTLGARLGSGGMGVVWQASDRLLRREVAVKQVRIPTTLPDDEREAIEGRVMREARAAAQLNHGSAVAVYDVAQEDGQAFIIMELVTAPSLADLVQQDGPLEPARAAEIGLQVLDALEAAHAKGIIHRDVKPGNVMVPDEGPVKLADFGIASVVDDPRLTATGLILGSPAYMAPEQAQEQEGSAATDLWGLGATLFYAVEGRPPFDKGHPIATLTAVLHEDVEISEKAGALSPVIGALLQKSPEARPEPEALRVMLEEVGGTSPMTMPATVEFIQVLATPTQAPAVSAPTPVPEEGRPGALELEASLAPPAYDPPIQDDGDDDRPGPWGPDSLGPGPSRAPWGRTPWVVAVAVVAAAALLLFIVLNQQDPPGGRKGNGKEAQGSTDTTAGEDQSPSDGSTVVVPSDWVSYTDDATGYQISYPPTWVPTPTDSPQQTDFRDPDSGSYLRVEWQQPPGESPEGAWEVASDNFGASHENYDELRITPTTFEGFDAAEWEFTYSDGGADLHALDLGFIAGDYGFALYFQTHAEDWDAAQPAFEALKASYQAPQ